MILGCENSDRKDLLTQPETVKVPDSIQILSGQFVFGKDAAMLRGKDFIYGVKIDSMSKDLAAKVAPFKSDDFEMIPVTIKAKLLPDAQQNGLPQIIEIRQIIETPKQENDTIKK
ncbi:hypothetical protein C7S20_06735 [Christiangramia fulva]|uniref:NlpE C-terminal OB domain-containing protein n=2 Tax=Christiangramia fulva TaxID=2126553 RepID=A0A2R3Z411_9FLAO|nr:hypothetical protein C7S20_06735 [Christiangramia fulva]